MKTLSLAGLTAGFLLLQLGAAGCGLDECTLDPSKCDDGNGNPTGPTHIDCAAMSLTNSSAPYGVYAWLGDGDPGVNHFFIWEVTNTGSSSAPQWVFASSGAPVLPYVLQKDWPIPTPLWSAGRVGTDGYDAHQFNLNDMFILGYLPPSPGVAQWSSSTGKAYDGTCPRSGHDAYGRYYCMGNGGLSVLDPQSPWFAATSTPLQLGHDYLARFFFGLSINDATSWIDRCYEKRFTYCPFGYSNGTTCP